MLQLLSILLTVLIALQLPLATLATSEHEHFPPYPRPQDWQSQVDARMTAPLAAISARVLAPTNGPESDRESRVQASYDREILLPEPQIRGASWLDYKAIIEVDFKVPVDPESALSKMQFIFDGQNIPLRLATTEDFASFHWKEEQSNSNFISVVANNLQPLPAEKEGTFKIRAGVKSKDGVSLSTKSAEQPVVGQYKNLQLNTTALSVVPGEAWPFQFNAPILSENLRSLHTDGQMIDGAQADNGMVTVEPPVPNLKIYTYNSGLLLKGDTTAGTTYTVTFKSTLPGFGCILGSDKKATVKVTPIKHPRLLNSNRGVTILPLPGDGKLIYPVYSLGATRLIVKARPSMIEWQNGDSSILTEKTIEVAPSDGLQKTDIDLSPIYQKGIRAFYLEVKADGESSAQEQINTEIQVTNLGITALQNGEANLFLVNNRQSGALFDKASVETTALDCVRVTNGDDSAILHVSQPRRLWKASYGLSSSCAANMSIGPPLTKPLIAGEETRLTLHINEHGKTSPEELINWAFTLKYADFKPPGWEAFHFGADNRTHSLCLDGSARWPQENLHSKPTAAGLSTIAYKLTDFQNPEPILAQITARRDGENAKKESTSVSDIIHPSSLTAGVKAKIQKAEQGFDLLVESIVCDLSGTIATAPLTLSARAKADGRLIEQSTFDSSNTVNKSILHVPTGEPVILTAEVTDKQGRLSRTSLECPVEYCRGQWERQPRLGLVTDKDWYQVGDKINLWIRSPFANSEGIIAVSTPKTFEKTICKLNSQSGLITLDVDPDMIGPTDIMVKLYEKSDSSAYTQTAEAPASEGLLNLDVGPAPTTIGLVIKHDTTDLEPGKKAAFTVFATDENKQPVPGCEISLQARQALRVAIESKDRASKHVNNITEISLDYFQPLTENRTFDLYKNSLTFGSVGSCCARSSPGRFSPVEYDPYEKVSTQTLRTDREGRATFEITLPTDLSAGALFVKADATLSAAEKNASGTAAICLPCSVVKVNKALTAAVMSIPPIGAPPPFRGVLKCGAAKVIQKKTSCSTTDIAKVLDLLIRECQRLAQNDPETVDSRAARIVTLTCLSKGISFSPQSKTKRTFDEIVAKDVERFKALNRRSGGRSNNWIEGVDPAVNEPPISKGINLLASTINLKDDKSVREFKMQLDSYGVREVSSYNRQPAPPKEADEVLAFSFYGLSHVPSNNEQNDQCNYSRNAILKRLTAPGNIKTLSVQALCWLILGTELHAQDEALSARLKAELNDRKDILSSECTTVEKTLLHDTPLIKKALLLNVLAGSSGTKDKDCANMLAQELITTLVNNDVHGDYELAFITPALLRYCSVMTKGPLVETGTAAPISAQTAPRTSVSQGVSIKRVFEAADGNAHLHQSADGAWHCKQGDIVRQVITFAPSHPIEHLILHDYFAPGLKTSESVLPVAHPCLSGLWLYQPRKTDAWCEHNDLEKNGLKAYGSHFDTRRFIYEYTLSAIAPGSFIVPPAEIRDPYDRQVFGTTSADRFVIEPMLFETQNDYR